MSTRRESWYHCTFDSKGHHVTAAVHAWSEEAAVEQFAGMVREVTHEPGTIAVELGLGASGAGGVRRTRVSARAPHAGADTSPAAH